MPFSDLSGLQRLLESWNQCPGLGGADKPQHVLQATHDCLFFGLRLGSDRHRLQSGDRQLVILWLELYLYNMSIGRRRGDAGAKDPDTQGSHSILGHRNSLLDSRQGLLLLGLPSSQAAVAVI